MLFASICAHTILKLLCGKRKSPGFAAGFLYYCPDIIKEEEKTPDKLCDSEDKSGINQQLSRLSEDDKEAILRFIKYAAQANGGNVEKDYGAIAKWLDERARQYTQSDI